MKETLMTCFLFFIKFKKCKMQHFLESSLFGSTLF